MSQNKPKKVLRHQKRKSPLPVILLLAGGLLIVGAIFAFRKPAQPKVAIEVTGAARLKVDRDNVNLGDVKLGQTVDVKFTLTNVGDQTLRFAKTPYVEVVEGC